MPKITVHLPDDDAILVRAYSADRGIPVSILARSALMSMVKRDVSRSGLLAAIEQIVARRVSDALAPLSAPAEAQSKRG